MADKTDIAVLAKQFARSQKILTALGDENRQHLILEMMQMGTCSGVRVGEITEKHIFPDRPFPIICKF